MIYGFIRDEALFVPPASGSILKPVSQNQGYGFADEDVMSLFMEPVEIPDTRAGRMTISQALTGKGRISIICDDADTRRDATIDGLSSENIEAIFDVVEKLLYLVGTGDINAALAGMTGFKPNSATRASTSTPIKFVYDNDTVENSKSVYDWIGFSMEFDTTTIDFKLWCKKTDVLSNFPFVNIIKLILPGDPTDLYTGNFMNGTPLSAIENAFSYNVDSLKGDADDYTGIKRVDYQYKSGSTSLSLPFAIFYKGRPPTTSDCQAAIKTKLLAEVAGSTEAGWTNLFPGVFTTSTFYLVPIWTARGTNVNNAVVPCSVVNWQSIVDIVQAKYTHTDASWMTDNYLSNYAEVLTVPGLPFFLLAIPDNANISANKSVKAFVGDEYNSTAPTTSTIWAGMSQTTKEFYTKIAATIALMENTTAGAPLESTLSWLSAPESIFDLTHYKFTAGSAVYAVLPKFSA